MFAGGIRTRQLHGARSQARKILLDPRRVSRFLDDVLDQVVAIPAHTGSDTRLRASSKAACINGALARATQWVRNSTCG
jgi:hypothetical protein